LGVKTTSCSTSCRSGPSPTTTRCTFSPSSGQAARNRPGTFFVRTRRLTVPITWASAGIPSSSRTAARVAASGKKRPRSTPFSITQVFPGSCPAPPSLVASSRETKTLASTSLVACRTSQSCRSLWKATPWRVWIMVAPTSLAAMLP
jgi:hypothetical protein